MANDKCIIFVADYDTTSKSKWICKSWFFVNHSAKTTSSWTLVAVTVERLLVVFLPLKAKIICTKKVAATVLAVMTTLGTCAHLHYFWSYGPVYSEGANNTFVLVASCSISNEYSELELYMALVRPWQDFLLRSAIPFMTLLVCNVLIICKVYAASARRRRLRLTQTDNSVHMRALVPMLLAVSFMYLVCITPMQVM